MILLSAFPSITMSKTKTLKSWPMHTTTRVVSYICNALDIEAGDVNIENFVPEKYDDKTIGY